MASNPKKEAVLLMRGSGARRGRGVGEDPNKGGGGKGMSGVRRAMVGGSGGGSNLFRHNLCTDKQTGGLTASLHKGEGDVMPEKRLPSCELHQLRLSQVPNHVGEHEAKHGSSRGVSTSHSSHRSPRVGEQVDSTLRFTVWFAIPKSHRGHEEAWEHKSCFLLIGIWVGKERTWGVGAQGQWRACEETHLQVKLTLHPEGTDDLKTACCQCD